MNITQYQNYHETKPHTDADFPYNTYVCSIPLDFIQVPLHWHDEIELIVIKKGQGWVCADFEKQLVFAGNIVFIPPGCLHSIEQDMGTDMEYENIIFKSDLLFADKFDFCAREFIIPLLNTAQSHPLFITPTWIGYTDAFACISHIDELRSVRPRGYQLAVKGYLFNFFFLLFSGQNNKDSSLKIKAKSLDKLRVILKYVEEHYTDSINIMDMAALCFYSKSHFMKFFKDHMGTSFITYLNDYRLSMAARLLSTTDLSILEIASQTGFDNLSFFNRIFRRKYSQTPSQYRRSN